MTLDMLAFTLENSNPPMKTQNLPPVLKLLCLGKSQRNYGIKKERKKEKLCKTLTV